MLLFRYDKHSSNVNEVAMNLSEFNIENCERRRLSLKGDIKLVF